MNAAGEQRKVQIQELEEIRNDAYIRAQHHNDALKKNHDLSVSWKSFSIGQKVMLFPSKLRSKWIGPFIANIFPHDAVKIRTLELGKVFKVNGHKLKPY